MEYVGQFDLNKVTQKTEKPEVGHDETELVDLNMSHMVSRIEVE